MLRAKSHALVEAGGDTLAVRQGSGGVTDLPLAGLRAEGEDGDSYSLGGNASSPTPTVTPISTLNTTESGGGRGEGEEEAPLGGGVPDLPTDCLPTLALEWTDR